MVVLSLGYDYDLLWIMRIIIAMIVLNQVTFQDTIFLLLHALCIFLGASVVLVFIISFVVFATINNWSHHVGLEGDILHFSFAKNTPFFTLIVSTSVLFFCYCFWFSFSPWFVFRYSYIYLSRCIFASGPCWFSSKELLIKNLNGVGKEKKFYAKKWYKKELM
jgi:hypothetical protein